MELKECPFCGDDAILYQTQYKRIPGFWIRCQSECVEQIGNCLSKDDAIKAWNNRYHAD